MRSRWDAIHADLVRSVHSPQSPRAFAVLKVHHPEILGRFIDPAALLARLSERGGDASTLDEADRILATLVRGAALPGPGQLAVELLILGMWPGLSATFTRLVRFYERRAGDLAADILARFTECVRRLDLTRCTRVAATLIRNTERVVRFARRLELTRGAGSISADESERLPDPAAERATDLVDLRIWLQHALPNDGDFVFAVVASGRSCRQVAEAFGISYASARQRLVRAIATIREKISQPAVTD
jgi:RNA polymerase sigma-70 factor (ECF subfamily)